MPSDNRISNSGATVWIGKQWLQIFSESVSIMLTHPSPENKQEAKMNSSQPGKPTSNSLSTLSMKFTPEN